MRSQRVVGKIFLPNMLSSVLVSTCVIVPRGDDLDRNLDGFRAAMGKCMAAFMPVPRIVAKRVAESRYARARRAEEESFTMAARRTLRFYSTRNQYKNTNVT